MKKYSFKRAKKNKLAYRTPSRFIIKKYKEVWKIKKRSSKAPQA